MSVTPPPPADRPIAGWWAIVKGLGTVFKQTFRADNTEQYPKEIAAPPRSASGASSAPTRAQQMRSGSRGRTTIPTSR